MDNFKHLRIMKMGGITPDIGEQICLLLAESTLDRLTHIGMDIRLIKPILNMAEKMPNGINDDNINAILNDSNAITRLMAIYCK